MNQIINLQALLPVARGQEPADLVLKNGHIINVFSGNIRKADLAISGGYIVGIGSFHGREELDVTGHYLAPGFIDAHLHLESCMLQPAELAKVVLPRGTTALIADPHEIANVLGARGVRHLIDSTRSLPLDIFFMAPSCVPATNLETSGAELTATELAELKTDPRILGLAEVMNFPGVINGQRDILEKLDVFSERPIDGHAPMLSGPDLGAYVMAGIGTDHECSHVSEAEEKLAFGQRILIRQGSQAKNLMDLLPMVNDDNFRRVAFCCDDRHPEDLLNEGHIDNIIRLAIEGGLSPVRAITMATFNAAETYGLRRHGALAPGYLADIVVLSSLNSMSIQRVYKNGRLVARQGEYLESVKSMELPDWVSPMNVKLKPEDLRVTASGSRVRVIEVISGQVLTGQSIVEAPIRNGYLAGDTDRDLARLVVVERHNASGRVGLGLVRGFGLKSGALASSVAHDSHNIIAVGLETDELWEAIESIRRMKGGWSVVREGRILAELPLPWAGLMSLSGAQDVSAMSAQVQQSARELGCRLDNPLMALSFLALPVIPALKLTDLGLVDVERFELTNLFV